MSTTITDSDGSSRSGRRLCLIAHSAKLEGADRSLVETARLLRARGTELHVLVPRRGPLLEELDRVEIPYTVCPYGWWLGKRGERWTKRAFRYAVLGASLATLSWVRFRFHGRFDVVYSNTLASPAGALIARWLGVPHVWHVREFVEEDHGLMFLLGRSNSLRFLNRTTASCIFNSQAVARRFDAEIVQPTREVVYQAVTLHRVPPSQRRPGQGQEPLAALILGRIQPSKGQLIAIRAVAKARESGVEIHLTIVGGGNPQHVQEMLRLGDALDVADLVTYVGYDASPLKHVAATDVVLVCSRQEAFGRVTIEAMKMGRPVIGTASGGTPELIDDGRTGWLYSPDDADDLASRLVTADTNRSHLAHMGEVGRAWAEATFSEERYGDRVLEIITNATGPTEQRSWSRRA